MRPTTIDKTAGRRRRRSKTIASPEHNNAKRRARCVWGNTIPPRRREDKLAISFTAIDLAGHPFAIKKPWPISLTPAIDLSHGVSSLSRHGPPRCVERPRLLAERAHTTCVQITLQNSDSVPVQFIRRFGAFSILFTSPHTNKARIEDCGILFLASGYNFYQAARQHTLTGTKN